MSKRVGGLRYTQAEALRTKKEPHGGMPVELHCLNSDTVTTDDDVTNDALEAEFVARRIEEILRTGETVRIDETERAIEADDIAILMRGVRTTAPVYMAALKRHGIDCVCGNENIFDSEEIGVLISLLSRSMVRMLSAKSSSFSALVTILIMSGFRFSKKCARSTTCSAVIVIPG